MVYNCMYTYSKYTVNIAGRYKKAPLFGGALQLSALLRVGLLFRSGFRKGRNGLAGGLGFEKALEA